MKNENKPQLERLDPEAEECFKSLAALVGEELAAHIAIGNDPSMPNNCQLISELIADAFFDGFFVQQRTTPQYRWHHIS